MCLCGVLESKNFLRMLSSHLPSMLIAMSNYICLLLLANLKKFKTNLPMYAPNITLHWGETSLYINFLGRDWGFYLTTKGTCVKYLTYASSALSMVFGG